MSHCHHDDVDQSLPVMNSKRDIPQLPYDLLRPLFEHLESDRTSLCAISLASSTFREEAQCILFRDVTTLMKRNAHIKFLCMVVESPTRLALFVHIYKQRLFSIIDELGLVETALQVMHNLKHLDITPVYTYGYIPTQVLRECTSDLEHFDARVYRHEDDEDDGSDILEQFLPRQPKLKHLGIVYSDRFSHKLQDPQCPFFAKICLQLLSVKGGWDMIKALLPGCKITTLSISEGIQINAASANQLAVEFRNIKALSISFDIFSNSDWPDCSFLECFPFLTMLELTALSTDEDIEILHVLSSFLEALSKLLTLQTLVLTDTNFLEKATEEENIQFIHRLLDSFGKNLKYVDLQIARTGYMRYMQSHFVQEISEMEARKVWLAEPIE